MTQDELSMICAYVASNWPAAAMTKGTLDIFGLEVGPLDYKETVATLREECADDEFPPTPMRLRNKVLRRRSGPKTTAEELVAELLRAVADLGYTGNPTWSDEAIDDYVHKMGGWLVVCQSTPAPGSPDYNTWYAQTRNLVRVCLEREDHAKTTVGALDNGHDRALGRGTVDLPDLRIDGSDR